MAYPGKESFVISLVDTAEKSVRIANVIFNGMKHEINIAVTSDKDIAEEAIREQILQVVNQVFHQKIFPKENFPFEEVPSQLLTTVSKPVPVVNRISEPFSMENVFCIGDAAGSSSPLAGLGGTLALTLVPLTVRQLLDDYEEQSEDMHKNFHKFSEGYTNRWIQKSEGIKKRCMGIFEAEQQVTEDKENGN
jgi:2-polyprenyl-6-methoxyphenol hydroxylase-like FAD-dependent oxidoreductase